MSISVMFPDVYYQGNKVATISVAEHNVYDLIDELHTLTSSGDADELKYEINDLKMKLDWAESERDVVLTENGRLSDELDDAHNTIWDLEQRIALLEHELQESLSHVK